MSESRTCGVFAHRLAGLLVAETDWSSAAADFSDGRVRMLSKETTMADVLEVLKRSRRGARVGWYRAGCRP